MKISNLKRFMASLLAVVMLVSVVGISPAAFADDAVAPVLKEDTGTVQVLIKDGVNVKDALAKALVANYDELTAEQIAAIDWQYYYEAILSKNSAWGTVDGWKKGILTYSPLAKQDDDKTFKVRIGTDGEERTIKKVSKYDTALVLKEGVSVPYNMVASEMEKAIIESVVDMSASTLPADVTTANLTLKRVTLGIENNFADSNGRPKDDAGDTPTIRIKYSGNDTYKACEADVKVNIVKATVKVSTNLVNTIYAGEEIDRNGFYTLDPNDSEIDVYMFFVGVNSNKKTCVNIKLSADQEAFINKVSELEAGVGISPTLKEKLQKGITLGELKETLNNVLNNKIIMGGLELVGYDTVVKNFLAAFNMLTELADDTIVAIGTPAHAGVYTATVVATGKNYETSEATGSLVVLKNWKGIKLAKNSLLEENNNTITVSQAEALKAANNLCVLTKDGEALNSASAGSIRYWFTGVNKIYAKSTMPTAPGKYIVTASVSGGDFFAMPKTFTFKIVADPAPEA